METAWPPAAGGGPAIPMTRLISTVDHVVEPPDLWTRRLSPRKWGDRIPHLVQRNGGDCWIIDGRRLPLEEIAPAGAVLDDRADGVKRWQQIPEIVFNPAARLRAMAKDGVECAVLYPSVAGSSGENLGSIGDPELEIACVRAYNDWLFEEWASASDRFIPQCLAPLWPPRESAREIERAVANGHRGVIFPAVPMNLRKLPHINDRAYDPLWAVCQELRVPLCFHAGSASQFQFPVYPRLAPQLAAAARAVVRHASAVFDLANFLFSQILLRFPTLNVVFAASTVNWGTFLLEYADHQYEQDRCGYELTPFEMFRRQCFLTTWYDSVEVHARHIGADNILWSSNFPAANSTWPDSRQFALRCTEGMSAGEREKVCRGNAARLYNLESGAASRDPGEERHAGRAGSREKGTTE